MAKAPGLKEKEKVLQEEIEKFKFIQKDIQKCVSQRKQLETQLNENKTVKEELDILEPDAVVYKLIGPTLIKQDVSEAKQTVEKRLDYISREIERCEKTYKDLENKQESLAEKLSKLQQDYQQAMMKVTGVAPTSNR